MLYSEKVRVFLTSHGMEPERVDFDSTTAAFISDMELGLRGRESSIRMIPTYLTADIYEERGWTRPEFPF